MKWKWLLIAFLIVTPVVFVRGDDAEDEDAVEGEEDEANVEDEGSEEPSAAAKTEKDTEEEDVKTIGPSPEAETVVVFTHPASNKELPAGKLVKFLVGFLNKGDKVFTIDTMDASFRYPMDYSFYIQNYTAARINKDVQPGQEMTMDYAFVPGEGYAGRPFGLTINVNYKDEDGIPFQSAVFNETINIVEEESGFNTETGFLYLVFACIVVLILLLGQQMLSKMRRKHGIKPKREAPVEVGTGNKNEVDFEWIPKEVLNIANKSPRPGSPPKSARARRARRAGSDD